jgi:bifunctional UDP-N-acetylglucosamine pyrophosphorylase / glucosamine-1-phosphate N-acetyltransferase
MGDRVNQVRPAAVVILAAGEGRRMRSRTPKVLHRIAGRTLLDHVLAATDPLGAARRLVVVGHGREAVTAAIAGQPDVAAVVQDAPNGTGHAVRTALAAVGTFAPDDLVVVVPGDAPLLTPVTLRRLVALHTESGADATLLTAVQSDPAGYGRVVRDGAGAVRAVVEQRDADTATAAIREIATSVYAFRAGPLADALGRLSTANAQGEEYLTDVVGMLAGAGRPVAAYVTPTPAEIVGVNDRAQLAEAGRLMRDRLVARAMAEGTTVVDPATTWVDVEVTFEPDSTLLPGVALCGRTHVGRNAVVGPDCTLTDTTVGESATVARTTATGSWIGPGAVVGPYTNLRAGTRLGRGAKAGAFVETKAVDIGDGAKVPHLSYVGDAAVGERSNIGCSTVFANYDGVAKHRTTVGADVKIGSNTILVSPVTIGDGAYTGAGAVIKDDVPPGALAVREGRQRVIAGWVERRRPGTAAARAAARASAAEAPVGDNGAGAGLAAGGNGAGGSLAAGDGGPSGGTHAGGDGERLSDNGARGHTGGRAGMPSGRDGSNAT